MYIKQKYKMVFAMALFLASVIGHASTIRHILWDKSIIQLDIPINKDKLIEVCSPSSQVGSCSTIPLKPYLPSELIRNHMITMINNNGTLYLNANQPFKNKLAELKLNDKSGDVVLVRLSATKNADTNRVQILLPNNNEPVNDISVNQKVNEDRSIGDMIRWVGQALYSPKRLLTNPTWIHRVPMHTMTFVPLYRGGIVSSMPIASWQSGDYYLTAVLLRNNLKRQHVRLRYSMLRGRWIAASFFRDGGGSASLLMPSRTYRDTTTLILVSSTPFTSALKDGVNNV